MSRGLEVGNRPQEDAVSWNIRMGTERDPNVRVQTVDEVRKSKGFGWDHLKDFLG